MASHPLTSRSHRSSVLSLFSRLVEHAGWPICSFRVQTTNVHFLFLFFLPAFEYMFVTGCNLNVIFYVRVKAFFFFFFSSFCGFTTWSSRLYFCHYKNHGLKFTACRIKQWESAAAWKSAGWGENTWIGGSDTHALKTSDHSLDADTCQLQTTHIPLVFKSN